MNDGCPKERRRPQNQEQHDQLNRRGFVGMLLATSASFALASVPLAASALAQAGEEERSQLKPGPKKAIARVADIPEGKALNFSYPDKDHPAILLHLPSGEFRAFDVSCTHLGCPVYWDAASARLKCP